MSGRVGATRDECGGERAERVVGCWLWLWLRLLFLVVFLVVLVVLVGCVIENEIIDGENPFSVCVVKKTLGCLSTPKYPEVFDRDKLASLWCALVRFVSQAQCTHK